ncbi:hypothetical protein P152DRAFT_435973 [Eremomyces bilateralis CBS 781.70]|uniref:Ribosomal protein/NADH dehydrogenase domain-containing protein n=1 Tax=Eremomyces bilateralis CBS 781.70 TaxID=1392243 RepID=A0A6G1G3K4_9PEZI|nr:uncharacterized protein P152DRAFT_435973 [Eremomyces bilateralis CBS 781.70]KAF1812644.1 hypothetical protein P152DRAFT_435973 [Eremomyces bilateralis CBS 781.70]
MNLRVGPGAISLSPEVSKLHLEFGLSRLNGNIYPAQFFSKCLSTLKYHNPAVAMTVNRFQDPTKDSRMFIYFREGARVPPPPPSAPQFQGTSDSTAKSSEPSEPDQANSRYILDMKYRHWSKILQEVQDITSAQSVKQTEEDRKQQAEIKKFLERSADDRYRAAETKKREDAEREYMANLA